ncbi:MAG: MATE family efflux transporter [Clostridia bacterium]|nr:MATE family efflux transporter [Clostridia bacterium]NCC42075.1 MATE family efflux transporter [Clostridia bacterium]
MIKDRNFYKTFGILTLSLALQNLLTYSVNLADNVMLGAYSESALSGVSLCNQFQFLLQMLVAGAGEGVVVMGSQYWGKGDLKHIPHIIGVALRFGLGMALMIFLGVLIFPSQLLGLLANDAAVISEGTRYMQIICFSYLIFTLTNILVTSLRCIGIVVIGYIISAVTLVNNIILNYCLIYGHFGLPRMGVQGAAVATLISRCLEFFIVIWFLKYKENSLNLTAGKLIKIDNSYFRDYTKISLPVLLNGALWGLAQMVQTGILGHLGAAAIAANSIATVVFQILSVVSYGAASAAGIVVGKCIGSGKEHQLKDLVHTLQVLFICIGIISGLLIYAIRYPVLSLYQVSEQAQKLAVQFMTILAITTVGTSYQMASDSGIIKGGGDTTFSMKMNLISMWGIVVPLSAVAAFLWKWPPIAVFFLLKWDQLYKSIPVYLRIRSWKWVRKVTR